MYAQEHACLRKNTHVCARTRMSAHAEEKRWRTQGQSTQRGAEGCINERADDATHVSNCGRVEAHEYQQKDECAREARTGRSMGAYACAHGTQPRTHGVRVRTRVCTDGRVCERALS
eukprot:79497-Pleurochrysis_carterae.AAC.1